MCVYSMYTEHRMCNEAVGYFCQSPSSMDLCHSVRALILLPSDKCSIVVLDSDPLSSPLTDEDGNAEKIREAKDRFPKVTRPDRHMPRAQCEALVIFKESFPGNISQNRFRASERASFNLVSLMRL